MRKTHHPLLFPSPGPEPEIFLFDTSAWFSIESLPDPDKIWAAIKALIEAGRLYTCRQVISEVRPDPIYKTRIRPFEKALVSTERSSPEHLLKVGKITAAFPGMSRPRHRKTTADPFVVALAQEEGYTVVTDETAKKRKNRKIPGACEKLNIKCVTLEEFVAQVEREDADC
jgi:hypothetical protein